MLTTGTDYRDLGGDYYQHHDPAKTMRRIIKQANEIGLTVRFDPIASLPTDPDQLYELLRKDSGGGKQSLVYAADALRTGLMPAAARANLLRALTYLPGLDFIDGAVDLDGHKGVALGISEGSERQEIILDPGTGEVIGEREVSDSMFAGTPKGTVTSYSSTTTAVVDRIGDKPTR